MRGDFYGTRFSVDLPTFAGEHDDYDPDDDVCGDAIYVVQEGLQEFVDTCTATAIALRNLENGLRALGQLRSGSAPVPPPVTATAACVRCCMHSIECLAAWHATFVSPPPANVQALSPLSTATQRQALRTVVVALAAIGRVVPFGSCVSGLHVAGGDLDLSLEGRLTWLSKGYRINGAADELTQKEKKAVLKHATAVLRKQQAAAGWVQQILNARVPIIKFTESGTDLACDLCIGGSSSLFKSVVLGQLAALDWRVGALIRLVKAWARQQGINNAGEGTLSSHALSLMVVWHLQMRSPAVLPPLSELFAGAARPMRGGQAPRMSLLQCQGSGQRLRNHGMSDNCETLVELLASFFSVWHALLRDWLDNSHSRRIVASTWHGSYNWSFAAAFGRASFSVEEPMDASDNVTRTVRSRANAGTIVEAFECAEELMRDAMEWHGAASTTLRELFGDELCYSSGALRKLNAAYVEPVPVVPMLVPDSLRPFVNSGTLPVAAMVDHQQPRY